MAKLLTVSDETTHIKSLRFHKPSIGNMCCTCAYREGRDHSAAGTRSPQESPRTGAAFSWPPVSVGFLRLVRGERTGRRFALKVLEFHVITGTFPQGSGRWNDVHEEGKGWMVVLIARGEGIFSGPWSLGREGCSMSYIGLNEKGLTARQTRVAVPLQGHLWRAQLPLGLPSILTCCSLSLCLPCPRRGQLACSLPPAHYGFTLLLSPKLCSLLPAQSPETGFFPSLYLPAHPHGSLVSFHTVHQ